MQIGAGPFLYFPSRIEHPNKNHLRLIQAFELLKEEGSFKGTLIFSGELWNGYPEVLKGIDASRYTQDIIYLGHVEKRDLSYLYAAADLIVLPSLYEGFGLPLLEALGCGAKVACSNTSSLQELAPPFVRTFDPYSPENIAKIIKLSLKDNSRGQQGVDYAQSFTWKRFAGQLLKEIKQL